MVEFDVPDFADMYAPERVAYIVERYQQGLAEYPADEVVAQGFLMPVMFGYFDRTARGQTMSKPLHDGAMHYARRASHKSPSPDLSLLVGVSVFD